MNKTLIKQLNKIEKQEQYLLNDNENKIVNITPIKNKIEGRIPQKVKTALDAAFYKGFFIVFDKGTAYIEKTYSKEKAQLEYDINDYAIDKKISNKHIRKISRRANYSKMINSSISVLEGGVLGFLGIGLPDIPLFIAVIMKTIYEIALSYGYDYKDEKEKAYIMLLICIAVTEDNRQKQFNDDLNKLQNLIDSNGNIELPLTDYIKMAADALSDAMLTAKFIQSIPIIGAVGSIVNYNIINKISKTANIKYKKRYLINKNKFN
ncbi:MAG: EcsC family protein [Eubacteriaceae bacterium]|nr:EcsC family protein [Eubacteriaceae bacterium]